MITLPTELVINPTPPIVYMGVWICNIQISAFNTAEPVQALITVYSYDGTSSIDLTRRKNIAINDVYALTNNTFIAGTMQNFYGTQCMYYPDFMRKKMLL